MPHSQPSHASVVGLCLGETETQAVELALDGILPTVRNIAEWHGGVQENPASIVQQLLSFIDTNTILATRIAVTVDTAALFTHVLPVPAGQSAMLMQKHARWDLTQFFSNSSDADFVTDVHILPGKPDAATARLLSVSVRRTFARALHEALAAHHLDLHVLDGDHFSAEHFLTSRHAEGTSGLVALAGMKDKRLDISVLKDGSLLDYCAWHECTSEACKARINILTNVHGQLRRVFVYGPQATQNMIDTIRSRGIPPVEVLDPFAGMIVSSQNPLATHFLAMPHRFVPAVGAALREE